MSESQTVRTKDSIFPVFLTVFIDLIGLGIIIPVIGPLLLNPATGILPADMPAGDKNLILGFLIASFPLAQFFGAPILGALSDKYGRKKILIISLIGTLLGYIVFAIGITGHNIYILFIARMLDGFTGGNIAIIQSSISDLSDEKNKTKRFGMIGMAFGLGFILGPYIGGTFSDPAFVNSLNEFTGLKFSNLATPFWFSSLLSFVNIIFVLLMFSETLRHSKDSKISLMTGFKNINSAFHLDNLRTLFIITFLYILGFNFFTQFFSVYLIDKFSFNEKQIGNFFAVIGLCGALSQGFVVRPLAKKHKPDKLLRVALISVAVAISFEVLPLLPFMKPLVKAISDLFSWNTDLSDRHLHAIQLYIFIPLISVFQGINFPNLNTLISAQADAKSQGEVFGISQSIQSIGFAIPPIISGIITSINVHLPIIVGSGIIFISGILFIVLFKPNLASEKLK